MACFDATIIGAGPAGMSVAVQLLRKGWAVLVVDKESLPRAKVCGGFIGPENLALLQDYGILEDLLEAGAKPVFHACLSAANGRMVKIPIATGSHGSYGLALSRKTFDDTLLHLVRSLGGIVMDSAKVTATKNGPIKGLALKQQRSDAVEFIETRHLIYTHGIQGKRHASQVADGFGVFALFENVQNMNEDVFLHFIDKGHLGTNRFENNLTNVCYVADKRLFEQVQGNLEALFSIFLQENPFVLKQLGQAKRVTAWKGVFVPKPSAPTFSLDGGFCAGDAVDVINPITGAGISLALSSGALLGKLLCQHRPEDILFDDVLAQYEKSWKMMFNWRIRLSRIWGALGHHEKIANLVIRTFQVQEALANTLFKYHHQKMPTLQVGS